MPHPSGAQLSLKIHLNAFSLPNILIFWEINIKGVAMLTATYTLATLLVEQNKTRLGLFAIQKRIENNANFPQSLAQNTLESVLDALDWFHLHCRQRKVEIELIPAIRKSTKEADALLAELESLNLTGLSVLESIRNQWRSGFEQQTGKTQQLYGAMKIYCDTLFKKLDMEELELFPMAARVISVDEWFAIADKLLHGNNSRSEAGARVTPKNPVSIKQASAYYH
jgi:hemerythrin-like domain-containing protein